MRRATDSPLRPRSQGNDMVIYHFPCSDGICSAWCFWRKNRAVKLIPAKHGDPPPNVKGKKVVIVDFSYKKDVILKMLCTAKHITILDHHESAEKELCDLKHPNLTVIFDMKKSGAQLAWDYLHPQCENGTVNRSWIVEMIADRDLWKWEYSWSKAVGKATHIMGYHDSVEKIEELHVNYGAKIGNFVENGFKSSSTSESENKFGDKFSDIETCEKELKKLEKIGSNKFNTSIKYFMGIGNVLIDQEKKTLEMYNKNFSRAKFSASSGTPEYIVGMSNCPRHLRSDAGNLISNMEGIDIAVLWEYNFPKNEWWISMRLSDKSTLNLSEICSKLPNGGGHAKAAGFTIYGDLGEDLYTYFTPMNKTESLSI
jgi:hypothetical protein